MMLNRCKLYNNTAAGQTCRRRKRDQRIHCPLTLVFVSSWLRSNKTVRMPYRETSRASYM